MKQWLVKLLRRRRFVAVKRFALFMRGVLFMGTTYQCPCCQWTLRGYVGREGFIHTNRNGYCPRCNSKARHRRIWLYLQHNTNLFTGSLRLLEVAPWWSLAKRFSRMRNIEFVGMDLDPEAAYTTIAGDMRAMPLKSESFDAVLCVHVLEHVDDDRGAIRELFRVLKPGAWAVVSVPLLLDEVTREDPSVVSPEQRQELFGETSHVRYYGTDFGQRLEAAGFDVRFDAGRAIPDDIQARFGVRDDENVFHCIKPGLVSG